MAEEKKVDTSEFNLALSTLERVNYLLTAGSMYSQKRLLHEWYDTLLTLLKDLDYLFDDGEEKINREFQEKLNPLDQQYLRFQSTEKLHKFEKFGYFAELLKRYEKFLRQGLNRRDMLMLKKPDATKAIINQ